MLGSCPCCPFLGRRCSTADDDDDLTVDRDPVLLVPGIGGSMLNSRKKKSGSETRVWVRIWLAALEFKKKLWSLYNPETGYTEELDDDSEIVVPDDDFGLYAIDILDPSLLMHLSEVYYFHDMIDMLLDCGYKKGITLFGFGYDFRQSNRIGKSMEGLKVKLETAHKASGCRRVNIISHSMGGLLVKCFMSLYPDIFAKYVNNWICLSCPFQGCDLISSAFALKNLIVSGPLISTRYDAIPVVCFLNNVAIFSMKYSFNVDAFALCWTGAPGCINDALLTGLQFVEGFPSYFFVSRWTMHQLLIECPSIYEMLPNPGFKWSKEPLIQVWSKESEKEKDSPVELESYGPAECSCLFEEALKHNELSIDGKTIPLPFNNAISKWATETRRVLNNAQLPKGVTFYNIYGTSYDTPFNVCYGSEESPVVDPSEICDILPEYSCVDGDETVPTESAKADGLDATERVAVAARHRELLCDKNVFELIQKWIGATPKLKMHKKTSKVLDGIPS
ncbi:hypothetical protein V2J09_007729 [Rumex salicifolius]